MYSRDFKQEGTMPKHLKPEILGVKAGKLSSQIDPSKLRWFTTVNFDDVPSGTDVSNHYVGVTFSTVVPSGRPVYAVTWQQSAKSLPNVVTLMPPNVLSCFDARNGAIKAQFTRLQKTVSIDALPLPTPETLDQPVTNQPFLEAFGENDTYLGKVLYPIAYDTPGYGSWQTLTYSSSDFNIRYVLFSSQYNGAPAVYAMFDNLSFQLSLLDVIRAAHA
jgi:hypothetical protein